MKFIIFCIFFILNCNGFIANLRNNNKLRLFNNNFDDLLDEKFKQMMNEFEEKIEKDLKNNLPISPKKEEDIIEDSFEGYLRYHFNTIKNSNNKLVFERFYQWREIIGTVLTKKEIYNIFMIVNKSELECDLMTFILLNQIIDENDRADFY